MRKGKTRRRNSNDRAGQSVRLEIEKPASAQTFSNQAADHSSHCCLRLVFAYQKRQQAGLFLKDLVPLTAIGSAYVWRAAPGSSDCPQLRMRLVWFGGTCFRMSETRGSASLRCIRRSKQWSRAKRCVCAICVDSQRDWQRAKTIRLRTRLRRDTEEQRAEGRSRNDEAA